MMQSNLEFEDEQQEKHKKHQIRYQEVSEAVNQQGAQNEQTRRDVRRPDQTLGTKILNEFIFDFFFGET